jgi:hypothetical protein
MTAHRVLEVVTVVIGARQCAAAGILDESKHGIHAR